MAIDKILGDDGLDSVADSVFSAVSDSVSEIKAMQKRKAAENVQVVIQALKKIEADIQAKYDGVTTSIETRVANIKDGRDGINGADGRNGRDGLNGKDGLPGPRGLDGKDGVNGLDGMDGTSVIDARIDFDGSLVIYLSNGREINVGEVMPLDLAERIKVITNGGGTSQSVLDTLEDLQSQIDGIVAGGLPDQTGNAGKYLTTDGTNASWATVSGGGGISSVASADGSVTVVNTSGAVDLSVATAGSTTNVLVAVRNTTGATLTKGTAVYISGATGQIPTVSKALADSDATSAQTLGLMTADLANNSNGYVTAVGIISNINTSAYTDGAQLYLSGTTAGTLTATKPHAPTHLVYIAVVEHAHPTQGKLFVKVQNGYEMDELHDVSAQSPSDGQVLIYNTTTSLWEKNTLTAGTGISVTNGAGSITIAATGGSGSGDVVGPASSTDKAIVTFDGTTGKLIQNNSGNTIGTTGNTVISVTDNTNAALRITQLGTGNALLVEDSTNPDASPFVINNSGSLVVGYTTTIAPSGLSASLSSVFGTTSAAGTTAGRYSDDVNPPEIRAFKSRSATVGSNTIVQSGDTIGRLNFYGDDGAAFILGAQINAVVDGTPGTNDMPGRLVFATTADGASTPTEHMRIDSAGNVGIGGTASSDTKFQLLGTYPTSGTNTFVQQLSGTSPSGTTNVLSGYRARLNTQAASFVLSNVRIFDSGQGTIGATSAITNQYGYFADASLTGATNNYGFYGDIASGANRFNLYMAGTAANYLGGQLQLGQDYIEKTNVANTSTAITLDLANGTFQVLTLTGSPTITMPTAVAGKSFVILLKTGTGSFTVTWSTVKWPGGTAPTITSTASKQDIFSFFSDGTNWYGTTVGQNYTP